MKQLLVGYLVVSMASGCISIGSSPTCEPASRSAIEIDISSDDAEDIAGSGVGGCLFLTGLIGLVIGANILLDDDDDCHCKGKCCCR